MSERRCPSCGGLVGVAAEWCGQCFTRLSGGDPPAAPEPGERTPETPAPTGGDGGQAAAPLRRASGISAPQGIRTMPDGIVWDCPTCGETNAIEISTCPVCGTAFAKLFRETDAGPEVDPGHAAAMSLIFPGLGHYVVGRVAEGVARGVVFAFALVTGLLTLFAGLDGGSRLFLMVMVLCLGSAAALYVLSTLDARRAARDLPPIVSTRMLLFGAVALMLLTMTLLTIAALQSAPRV